MCTRYLGLIEILKISYLYSKGMTKTINSGCFDSRFPSETWEVIFDAYYSGQAEPQGESGDQGDYDPEPTTK